MSDLIDFNQFKKKKLTDTELTRQGAFDFLRSTMMKASGAQVMPQLIASVADILDEEEYEFGIKFCDHIIEHTQGTILFFEAMEKGGLESFEPEKQQYNDLIKSINDVKGAYLEQQKLESTLQ